MAEKLEFEKMQLAHFQKMRQEVIKKDGAASFVFSKPEVSTTPPPLPKSDERLETAMERAFLRKCQNVLRSMMLGIMEEKDMKQPVDKDVHATSPISFNLNLEQPDKQLSGTSAVNAPPTCTQFLPMNHFHSQTTSALNFETPQNARSSTFR